ncbi:MAG: hypothetical protein MJ094_05205 [Saccharofermentans sp.]|nr:hypothetical protein [Saccharofermentans sp.]
MRKSKREDKLIILVYRVVAGLVCAVLITTSIVSGLFAKYTSTGSANDYSRVAKFDVLGEGVLTEPILISLAPSDEGRFVADISVNSDCEVAVACSVTIDNQYQNIVPLQFELRQKSGDDYIDSDGVTTFTYDPASEDGAQYGLFLYVPEDENTPDSNLRYRGMVDYLIVNVTATQID